jgi:hypothetical protein
VKGSNFKRQRLKHVKLSLCLINYAPRRADLLVSESIASLLLSSTLDEASRPGRFSLGERAFGIDWIKGWVGPRLSLDAVEYIKISCPFRE